MEVIPKAKEEWLQLLHKPTGELASVSGDCMGIAEEMEEGEDLSKHPDWDEEDIDGAHGGMMAFGITRAAPLHALSGR